MVHHSDPIRIQIRGAGRDQVHDRTDLRLAQGPPTAQVHDHRRAGRAPITHEHRLLTLGNVHTRAVHRIQRCHSTRQFALHRPMVARPLDHPARTQAGILLQQLEAHVAGTWQAFAGQLQPRTSHLALGHLHLPRRGIDLILDTGLRKDLHDLRRILRIHARKQRYVGRAQRPVQQRHDHHNGTRQHADQGKLAARRHPVKLLDPAGHHRGQGLCIFGHRPFSPSARSADQTCIRMIS